MEENTNAEENKYVSKPKHQATDAGTNGFKVPDDDRHEQMIRSSEAKGEKNEVDLDLTTNEKKETFAVPAPQIHSTKSNSLTSSSKTNIFPTKKDTLLQNKPPPSLKSTSNAIPLPYNEPVWSGNPEEGKYSFDVLKNGQIIDNFSLKQSLCVFGRLPSCDVTLEHPSLSRYHAVIQFSKGVPDHEQGWYIYDLDSTHGTWINKRKLFPNKYYRLKVGYVIKFGGSSRLHILQGPEEDQEEESEMTVSEMKEQREKMKKEAEILKATEDEAERLREEERQRILQDRGCSWGMGEDAVEDSTNEENPFSNLLAENESLYIDDPKKALKGFYEREGCDLPEYQFTDVGAGKHKCVLDIPVDGPNGEDLVSEVVVSGKRKDAVIACALEACRMIDRLGMLRSSKHESRKRKGKKWEDDDFYDSDEDTFLDRTGTIEQKRVQRMKKAGKDSVETYDSILEKYNKVSEEIMSTESQLEKAKQEAASHQKEDVDELDAYMASIKAGAMDTRTRMRLKAELMRLRVEEARLRRLLNVARPAHMPALLPQKAPSSSSSPAQPPADSLAKKLHAQQKLQKKVAPGSIKHQPSKFEIKPDDFEEHEDEDEDAAGTFNEKGCESISVHPAERGDTSTTNKVENRKCESLPDSSTSTTEPVQSRKREATYDSSTKTTLVNDSKKARPRSSNVTSTAAILKAEQAHAKSQAYSTYDPDYAVWMPPTEQSGDGRTSLNDKLGY